MEGDSGESSENEGAGEVSVVFENPEATVSRTREEIWTAKALLMRSRMGTRNTVLETVERGSSLNSG